LKINLRTGIKTSEELYVIEPGILSTQHILKFVDALWQSQSQALNLRDQKTAKKYYNSVGRV
jgi:hypothetical protein